MQRMQEKDKGAEAMHVGIMEEEEEKSPGKRCRALQELVQLACTPSSKSQSKQKQNKTGGLQEAWIPEPSLRALVKGRGKERTDNYDYDVQRQ